MALGYLFSWYPMPSQTALRREAAALEQEGVGVRRFCLRRYAGEIVDPDDRAERDRTRAVLDVGARRIAVAVLSTAAGRPARFSRAFAAAVRLGRRDDRGLLRTLIYLCEACVLLKWFAEFEITHVHAHYATTSATAAMFCRIMGGPPYSFTMHGPEEFDDPAGLSLGEKVHRSAFTVAISEFTRSQLYRWTDFADWSKIHVVRVGVSPMFLELGPQPPPMAPRLVSVGRIVEQKGQAILIQAAARLRDRGRDFELVLVGDGPMRGEIQRLIDELDLRRNVRVTGYLSNQGVRDEMLAARALVLPSFAEGLPGVFFEALAVGRPVISTYIAGHPELIENGVNGWLVPAGAVDPLADAMDAALALDQDALERMGRAGAERVAEMHDPSILARRLAELFGEFMGSPALEREDRRPVAAELTPTS